MRGRLTTTAISMIVLLFVFGSVALAAHSSFNDVSDGDEHADGIHWASENNVVVGYGDGTFGPQDNITRGQAASMFQRYFNEFGGATPAAEPQGPQGPRGPQGPAGTAGSDGENGADGATSGKWYSAEDNPQVPLTGPSNQPIASVNVGDSPHMIVATATVFADTGELDVEAPLATQELPAYDFEEILGLDENRHICSLTQGGVDNDLDTAYVDGVQAANVTMTAFASGEVTLRCHIGDDPKTGFVTDVSITAVQVQEVQELDLAQ